MKLRECKNVVYLHEHEHIESEKRILLLLDKGEINMEILFNPFFEGEISSKERDPDYIKFYFKQMVKAVEEIHKHNVVHSDLKPENFILFEGRVKLIDFGISSIINENQTSVIKQSNFYLGTVDYMSPETLTSRTNPIFMGKGKRLIKYNKKTDIWSLGCILYDMACGHTPFQFCRNKLRDIKNPKFKINYSEVKIEAKGLVDCIKKCLQYDPNRRPTASELLDDPFLISK
jgi:serine/threonine-protein kinase TTK/MPS1